MKTQPPSPSDWSNAGHKWMGSHVAWPFGPSLCFGTVVAWRRDDRRRCMLWRVKYDDGDEEDYELRHMHDGLRFYREHYRARVHVEGEAASRSTEDARPKRRASSVVTLDNLHSEQPRRQRKEVDPLQPFVTFPVVISPMYLTMTPWTLVEEKQQLSEDAAPKTPLKRRSPLAEQNGLGNNIHAHVPTTPARKRARSRA